MPTGVLEQLARIAHDLWRDRMIHDGWMPADHYDERRRLHDALRPFEALTEADRIHARTAIRVSGVVDQLIQAIDYPRGADTPSPWRYFAVGCRVRLVGVDEVVGLFIAPDDVGVVESVLRSAGGLVTELTVRWPSGDRTVHGEADQDLAIVR